MLTTDQEIKFLTEIANQDCTCIEDAVDICKSCKAAHALNALSEWFVETRREIES